MCTHLWAPVLEALLWSPSDGLALDEGAARTTQPHASCPPACPGVPEVTGDQLSLDSPTKKKKKKPHDLLVFSSVLYHGGEEPAQKVTATCRNVRVTSPWGHSGLLLALKHQQQWPTPPAPQPGTTSAGDGNIWSKRTSAGEGWWLQQGHEGLWVTDCTQTGKLCSPPRSLCTAKGIVWSYHRISRVGKTHKDHQSSSPVPAQGTPTITLCLILQ